MAAWLSDKGIGLENGGRNSLPIAGLNPAASHPRRLRLPAYARVMVWRNPRTTFASTTAAEQGRFHWGTLGNILGPGNIGRCGKWVTCQGWGSQFRE